MENFGFTTNTAKVSFDETFVRVLVQLETSIRDQKRLQLICQKTLCAAIKVCVDVERMTDEQVNSSHADIMRHTCSVSEMKF